MEERSEYERDIEVVCSFVTDIIETAMQKFHIDFATLDKILLDLGYWERFNDIQVACVGAHYGIDPVLQKIERELFNK